MLSYFILPASAAVQTGIITDASTVRITLCVYGQLLRLRVHSGSLRSSLSSAQRSTTRQSSQSVCLCLGSRSDTPGFCSSVARLTHTVNMSNKAKTGGEDEEKQSPTDLQEIQLQMNATTDEVRACVCARPLIIIQQFINDITALSTECGCIYCRDENATGNEHRSAERIDVCIKPRLVHA